MRHTRSYRTYEGLKPAHLRRRTRRMMEGSYRTYEGLKLSVLPWGVLLGLRFVPYL